MPSSYSNETMPNEEQYMLTLSEHETIQLVLKGHGPTPFYFSLDKTLWVIVK
jgi:hypothetical protein